MGAECPVDQLQTTTLLTWQSDWKLSDWQSWYTLTHRAVYSVMCQFGLILMHRIGVFSPWLSHTELLFNIEVVCSCKESVLINSVILVNRKHSVLAYLRSIFTFISRNSFECSLGTIASTTNSLTETAYSGVLQWWFKGVVVMIQLFIQTTSAYLSHCLIFSFS